MAWLTSASNTTSVEVVLGPEINDAMATDCATMTAYLEGINLKGLICFFKRMRSKSLELLLTAHAPQTNQRQKQLVAYYNYKKSNSTIYYDMLDIQIVGQPNIFNKNSFAWHS